MTKSKTVTKNNTVLDNVYLLEMQQYGSTPYCILPLSVLQYITILQYFDIMSLN